MSTTSTPRKIGLIGLGLMGKPMAANLLKAGHSLTVWNRTPSRAQDLVDAGAKLGSNPQEVAAASDLLITMVGDPPALEEVLWGHDEKNDGALDGLKPGNTYIDCSTISPTLVKKIAEFCAERKIKFLDAPVTGGDWGAREGTLTFMVGGDAETVREVEPIFAVMGKKWFHLGPNGAGQTIKLAMNALLALQIGAVRKVIALVTRAGLKGEQLLRCCKQVWRALELLDIKDAVNAEGRLQTEFSSAPDAQGSWIGTGFGQSVGRSVAHYCGGARNLQLGKGRSQRRPGLLGGHPFLEEVSFQP